MKSSFIAVSALLVGLAAPALANDNLSKIDQIGSTTTASVEQTGTDNTNTATVKQGINSAAFGNSVEMHQTGQNNDNLSTVFQFGGDHSAIVVQDGDDNSNSSVLTQAGFNNEAIIHQGGVDNVNDSRVQIQAGTGDLLTLDQFGDNNSNKSFVSMYSHDSSVEVQQHGSDNTNDSTVYSGKTPFDSNANSVVVNQQ
jgi:hypothetical protein